MDVKTLHERIDELSKQLEMAENNLILAIKETIFETAKETTTHFKKISQHHFVINVSELIDKPWTPSFYNWEKSGEIVFEYLQKKPAREWKNILIDLLKTSNNNVICIKTNKYCKNGSPVDRRFIEKIVERI